MRLVLGLVLVVALVLLGPVRLSAWLIHHYFVTIVYVTAAMALNRNLFRELVQ